MNKLNTLISSILVFLGIAFFALVIYVSMLGDNHKIDYLVTRFFDDLKSRNYTSLCQTMATDKNVVSFGGTDPCQDFFFILEMSFLSRYNLLDRNDYSIEIKRDHFWIPYLTDDRVRISIAFSEKKKNIIQEFIHGLDADDFVQDFMLVERRKGQWVIKEINLEGSSLYPIFNELKVQMDLDRYLLKTEQGFILKGNEIIPDRLTDLERRLLDFSLFKLSQKP